MRHQKAQPLFLFFFVRRVSQEPGQEKCPSDEPAREKECSGEEDQECCHLPVLSNKKTCARKITTRATLTAISAMQMFVIT